MLGPGDPVPAARVWQEPRADAVPLRDLLAADAVSLVLFYRWSWSPT